VTEWQNGNRSYKEMKLWMQNAKGSVREFHPCVTVVS